jgi:hypothetical protein
MSKWLNEVKPILASLPKFTSTGMKKLGSSRGKTGSRLNIQDLTIGDVNR